MLCVEGRVLMSVADMRGIKVNKVVKVAMVIRVYKVLIKH